MSLVPYQPGKIAEKVDYMMPDGDMPAIEKRTIQIFRADANKYSSGQSARIPITSNDAVIDTENSYFQCDLSLEISGAADSVHNGQYTYETVRPILENGFEDLIKEMRVESYGKAELEKIRNYNHLAHFKHQITASRAQDQATNRFTLRGDCLNSSEARAIVSNTVGQKGEDITGVPVIFKLSASGFMNNPRYVPLRFMSNLDIIMDFADPRDAFHQELVYSTSATDYNDSVNILDGSNSVAIGTVIPGIDSGTAFSAVPAGRFSTDPRSKVGVCPITGRVHPAQMQTNSAVGQIQINYTISNLRYVAEIVKLSPPMEAAMLTTLESPGGLPYWFSTWETQVDQCLGQNFTQRIGKGVANANRVFTKFVHQNATQNQSEDGFASEPLGLSSFQYRLGTTYYPKEAVVSQYQMVMEADKAANWPMFRNPIPLTNIRKQIGCSFQTPNWESDIGTATQKNKGALRQDITQCYLPDMSCVPCEFRIGQCLMAAQDATISGVNTNHGHQLELYIQRFQSNASAAPLVKVPIAGSNIADVVNRSVNIYYTRAPIGSQNGLNLAGAAPRSARYSWASADPILVFTFLEYTRALIIRPDYLIEIRE